MSDHDARRMSDQLTMNARRLSDHDAHRMSDHDARRMGDHDDCCAQP